MHGAICFGKRAQTALADVLAGQGGATLIEGRSGLRDVWLRGESGRRDGRRFAGRVTIRGHEVPIVDETRHRGSMKA